MSAEQVGPVEQSATEPSSERDVNPMEQMLESYLSSCRSMTRGEIVPGTVVHVGRDAIVIDIGAKCEGVVTGRELEQMSQEEYESIVEGQEVSVYVVSAGDAAGEIVLSLRRARAAQDWREAQRLLENEEIIESTVIGCNKGGVIVQIGQVRGFVPGSQLAASHIVPGGSAGARSEDRWASMVGERLQLRVIEVDQTRNRLILSERASRERQRKKLLAELSEGDERLGRVTNLADFGAFVDLGGMDGLVHLSEMAWKRVSHPGEVVKVGQEVRVSVLGVDLKRQRVALSLKRLQPDPWSDVAERYEEGQLIEGTIKRLTKWGAFASIIGDDAIEGLIHVSELDHQHVANPADVVHPGQLVTLRIVSLDAARRRMALSLKQVDRDEFLDKDWETAAEAERVEMEGPLSTKLSGAFSSEEH